MDFERVPQMYNSTQLTCHVFQERGTEVVSAQNHGAQLTAEVAVEREHFVHDEVIDVFLL